MGERVPIARGGPIAPGGDGAGVAGRGHAARGRTVPEIEATARLVEDGGARAVIAPPDRTGAPVIGVTGAVVRTGRPDGRSRGRAGPMSDNGG